MRRRLDRGCPTRPVQVILARQYRRDSTPAERYVWSLLRGRRMLGLKFRRQHVIGAFIVDFYCPQLRLVLELDGGPHDRPAGAEYDTERTRYLESSGLRVVRLRNRDVNPERPADILLRATQAKR